MTKHKEHYRYLSEPIYRRSLQSLAADKIYLKSRLKERKLQLKI